MCVYFTKQVIMTVLQHK